MLLLHIRRGLGSCIYKYLRTSTMFDSQSKHFLMQDSPKLFASAIMESFGIAVFLSLGCCKFDNGYDASQLIDALIESHLARREGRRREGEGGREEGRGGRGRGGENNKEMHRPSCSAFCQRYISQQQIQQQKLPSCSKSQILRDIEQDGIFILNLSPIIICFFPDKTCIGFAFVMVGLTYRQ